MSLLERLLPLASTLAWMVGTGLLTLPVGLVEVMVMAPVEPPFPLPCLVTEPLWLVILCALRWTSF
jgi:hypothetical protein